MRILVVTSRYIPHAGGLETVVNNLVQEYQRAGHDIIIVTNRYPRSLPKHEVINSIPVYRFFFLYPQKRYLKSRQWLLMGASFLTFPQTLWQLSSVIHNFRPDIVNLHYLGAPAFFLWLLDHFRSLSLVVSLHGGDVVDEPHRSQFNRWLFGALVRRACSVTACSRSLLAQAITLEPSIQDKTFVLHNGVEKSTFAKATSYRRERPYVLAVGQLVPHKGFDFLVRVFARLTTRFPNVDLLIVGEGPENAALQELVQELDLAGRVVLLGKMLPGEVAALMKGSLLVAAPSFCESFGIVVLEAMAAGRPVLATPVGGIPEFADTPCNRLVAPKQDLWVEALGSMLEASMSDRKPCRPNQLVALQYQWADVAKRYLSLYEQVLVNGLCVEQ